MLQLGNLPRFAVRQVGATWTVYRWQDLEPARIDGVAQIGLDRDAAIGVAERLNLGVLLKCGPQTKGGSSLGSTRGPARRAGAEAA